MGLEDLKNSILEFMACHRDSYNNLFTSDDFYTLFPKYSTRQVDVSLGYLAKSGLLKKSIINSKINGYSINEGVAREENVGGECDFKVPDDFKIPQGFDLGEHEKKVYFALSLLEKPVNSSLLSKKTGISKESVMHSLKNLEGAGLVDRVANLADARSFNFMINLEKLV